MNEKKNISDILSNLRTKKQNTDLKACNYKLNKFGKDIVEAVLKKCPDIQKKAMTGAERQKKSRERMHKRIRERMYINFLMSSSHFETFVKTNKLESKLHGIAVKYADEKDIAKLVFTIFHEFISDIAVNLQEQMRSMFMFSIEKEVKFSYQKKLKKADETENFSKTSYYMELKIRNEKNRKLDTIEKIFKNHLETKIEKEKDKKYQQQEELIECRMSS